MGVYSVADLTGFTPRYDNFVGIDSDGCVFDSMAVKQKDFFHPLIIQGWGLEAAEQQLRECAEFVNLHSVWRGQNRFLALLMTFDLLAARADVQAMGVPLPSLDSFRTYLASGVPLGNPSLQSYLQAHPDPELARVLAWSLAVNREIEERMPRNPAFPHVLEALSMLQGASDTMVVSQTPEEALVKEWREQQLDGYVRMIAGQELGTKCEHLQMAATSRYPAQRILLLGDAPGDRSAARDAGVLFFPINPGAEAASWQRFVDEAYARFIAEEYAGEYQDRLIAEFEALLPRHPPWEG
jgi:phosphoglycolate phosphatase-like HAD superfamily hydrolase